MKEINSNGFNMADDTRKVRVEERLKIKIGEAKNLPARSHGAPCHRDTYCVLSLDQEEIFRTSTMERTLNPFFGEEFQFEVPRRFRYLSIYLFDRDKHLKTDKVLGKVAIKREDLHRYNNKDHWFALRPVDADSEVQGKAYIEVTLEDSRKRLRVEPKPPDPDPAGDNCSARVRGNNLVRLSEYCKESMRFGSCSSSTSKKLVGAGGEPALSRSESMKDQAQLCSRTKPPLHPMPDADGSPAPSPSPHDYWSDPERHCDARVGPDTLRLRVLECSELTTKNGQCDPFAIVTMVYSNGRRIERRTKPRKKTVNPQFDEIFCFDLVTEADPKDKDSTQSPGVASEARVSVWHDAASPVFLGEVRLQLRQTAPTPMQAWYFLSSRAGGALSRGATPPGTRLSAAGAAALGSLRLLLQYTVDHVFPLNHYRHLEELLLRSVDLKPITASAVYILGEIVASKTEAAQPLVRLFTHHDLIVPVVRELADAEISVLTDATTIFRGNTLVSKMMDEAMRLSGAAYLRAVLRPTLSAVLAERRPCEIDPARVKPAAAVSANLANLKDYVERVFSAITSSYAACPASMCRLFDALRQCAARHFPRNGEVRYSVVSGFIFLRFFAPAILGPKLFDLTNEHIDPQTNRTLTLISKTIQSLGNLVSSRSAQQVCKEEYMAELYRSFCTTKHVQAIKQFLEIISTTTDTHNNNDLETPVLLKEGTMIKRSEGARAGAAGSPRRRWPRAAHTNSKRRLFRLTSGELSWSRVGAKAAARRLPLAGVLAVAAVEHPPAGAPLGAANIFQIVHRERTLILQAGNCVERAEWVRLLSALARLAQHRGYYCDAHWTCCGATEPGAPGCGGASAEAAEAARGAAPSRAATLALRLDPARDLQRLHALLVAHAAKLDDRHHRPLHDSTCEEREAAARTLRQLQDAMFDLEHRHRVYRRSLARETKYGSKQAPIGDDNYLHLAGAGSCGGGAGGGMEGAALAWRARTEHYLAMTGVPPAPAAPARPPRADYVTVSPRAPPPACTEYELMADFMSAARAERPPAVPPRRRDAPDPPPAAPPSPLDTPSGEEPAGAAPDSVSNDDSLLDELKKDYCVLQVCEDETTVEDIVTSPEDAPDLPLEEKEEYGIFSRMSVQRKSNPTKSRPSLAKTLKTSNSTSNVHDATHRPLTERLTPSFLKKKPKATAEEGPSAAPAPAKSKKEEEKSNLIGRLTPRFGQSRLIGRGRSLELGPEAEGGAAGARRVERSASSLAGPRPLNSSIVANLKFLSLHRYGEPGDVTCRRFARTPDEGEPPPPPPPVLAAAASSDIRL